MKLKGKYELTIEYELPDGTYTNVDNIVNFFLNDNYDAIPELEDNLTHDYIYLDDSKYGILETTKKYLPILRSIRDKGLIDRDFKIVNHVDLLFLLKSMHEDAVDLCNNMKEYEREVKLNMVIDEA